VGLLVDLRGLVFRVLGWLECQYRDVAVGAGAGEGGIGRVTAFWCGRRVWVGDCQRLGDGVERNGVRVVSGKAIGRCASRRI
jgi:hypothetical protein